MKWEREIRSNAQTCTQGMALRLTVLSTIIPQKFLEHYLIKPPVVEFQWIFANNNHVWNNFMRNANISHERNANSSRIYASIQGLLWRLYPNLFSILDYLNPKTWKYDPLLLLPLPQLVHLLESPTMGKRVSGLEWLGTERSRGEYGMGIN